MCIEPLQALVKIEDVDDSSFLQPKKPKTATKGKKGAREREVRIPILMCSYVLCCLI